MTEKGIKIVRIIAIVLATVTLLGVLIALTPKKTDLGAVGSGAATNVAAEGLRASDYALLYVQEGLLASYIGDTDTLTEAEVTENGYTKKVYEWKNFVQGGQAAILTTPDKWRANKGGIGYTLTHHEYGIGGVGCEVPYDLSYSSLSAYEVELVCSVTGLTNKDGTPVVTSSADYKYGVYNLYKSSFRFGLIHSFSSVTQQDGSGNLFNRWFVSNQSYGVHGNVTNSDTCKILTYDGTNQERVLLEKELLSSPVTMSVCRYDSNYFPSSYLQYFKGGAFVYGMGNEFTPETYTQLDSVTYNDQAAPFSVLNDYRHFILLPITLGFIALGLVFHQALPRLGEAFRNLAVSFAYYVTSLGGSSSVRPTVTQMPSWQFAPSRFERLRFLPWTWEEFQTAWGRYWQAWASLDNLEDYFAFLGDAMFYLSKGLLVLTMVLPLLFMLGKMCLKGKKGERYSKPLKNWQSFSRKVLLPFKKWLKDFAAFFNETSYKQIWILLWVLYFNIPAIVVDFFAYYLYFVPSFDVASLYGQLLKLTVDLAPMVRFIPVVAWIVIGFWALNAFCRSRAFDTLDHCERKNAGFVNERGVVTVVYGKMGVGKTSLLTSMALTEEANQRRMALEVLLENDIKFPHFPWDRLRAEIKQRMENRVIVDARYSVEAWLRPWRQNFEWFAKHPESCKWLHRNAIKRGFPDWSFGYDFNLFPTTYNDELSLTKLYDAIEEYTKAYIVYAVDCSLIISNYSIRTDALREELNNFPIWNHDFFSRDVRLQEAQSRHCHILDFDMLRLGKRMVENNPNRNAFGFGVYIISEVDKERKNALELKEMKIKEDVCNQRNDLFNSFLKMSRHAVMIGNRVFLKIFCDLQRPEDWGAGGREVGEVVFIDDKGPMAPVLPFFSPFWICEGIYKLAKKGYDEICVKHIFPRFEQTLFVHCLKSVFAKLDNHYKKVNNLFGCQVLTLQLESGTLDGPVKEHKYYRMPKKDFSKRYSSNCLSAVFDGDEPNKVAIWDLKEYADVLATWDEWSQQHSHFYADVSKMKSA